MGTPVKARGIIINRVPGGVLPDGVRLEVEASGLPVLAVIPMDENVAAMDAGGIAIGDIPGDAPARVTVNSLIEEALKEADKSPVA
jgi:CO dehydrogenase nickel-insertion accessory protein CooC1